MAYTPHTPTERQQMLEAIGVPHIDDLFSDVPDALRFPELKLPDALSPLEVQRLLGELAQQNNCIPPHRCFVGAGVYHHDVPSIVADVLTRPALYTAYTPYQPELSQGTLQATFEYQSMISALTGLPVSNASHYDGATALAEAVMLALAARESEASQVLFADNVNPQYRQVVQTYLQGTDVQLVGEDWFDNELSDLKARIDDQTAAVVIQTPGFLGELTCLEGLAESIHAVGGMLIVLTDPIALGLFEPPGSYGADVVVAEGQALGLPTNFGGPGLGIFAVRRKHVRRLAGRLVGQTQDQAGRRGYVLTLATREQHIRRARATSNICTNSALSALAAAVYLASVGQKGLRQTAELCFHKSHYLADQLHEKLGLVVNPQTKTQSKPWFREFVVQLPCNAAELNESLVRHSGMIGGLDLGAVYGASEPWNRRMLMACTEVHKKADLDAFVVAVEQAIDEVIGGGSRAVDQDAK